MPQEGTEHRKLTAIMFTDMVGYSALAERNEELALELLEEHRRLLRSIFPKHRGSEIKTIGDGFLAEFSSALAAVQCGIEIQEMIAKRNSVNPSQGNFQVRIGIHAGDVVHRDDDVIGDGVNIAARIEPLAEAGGICISQQVFDQVVPDWGGAGNTGDITHRAVIGVADPHADHQVRRIADRPVIAEVRGGAGLGRCRPVDQQR